VEKINFGCLWEPNPRGIKLQHLPEKNASENASENTATLKQAKARRCCMVETRHFLRIRTEWKRLFSFSWSRVFARRHSPNIFEINYLYT
jgi:hypothetical protein